MNRLGPILLLFAALATGCDKPEPIRNVILITFDTLRADHLSCYGYPLSTSPELDRFLDRGVLFQHAFSTSCRTAPSHVSLMTGLYPSFTTVDVDNGVAPLHSGFVTLAEICQENDLRTAAVISNPVLGARLALDQGFEDYDAEFPDTEINRGIQERIAEKTVDRAVRKLDDFKEDRFFLWVHFQDPHGPYTPPTGPLTNTGPHRKRNLAIGENHAGFGALPKYQALGSETELAEYIRRYNGEIRYLDTQLGRLFDRLTTSGRLTDTLVILTADHGEAFGENNFFCAHGHGLGLDQTRVPLGFVGADLPEKTHLSSWVSNIDVFATALDALGIEARGSAQSESLLRDLRRGSEPTGRTGYAEAVTQRAVFQTGLYLRKDRRPTTDTAFWETGNPFTGAPYVPLETARFSRIEAPGSSDWWPPTTDVDLSASDPLAQLLIERLNRFADQAESARAEIRHLRGKMGHLSDTDRDRLRALGYLK